MLPRANHRANLCVFQINVYHHVNRFVLCALFNRRLDFIVVPWHERAPALLYFTGSAYINRSMRALAKKKGWSLSQHGLRKYVCPPRLSLPCTMNAHGNNLSVLPPTK